MFCCRAQIWTRCVLSRAQERGMIPLPGSAPPLRVHCPCFTFSPSGSSSPLEKDSGPSPQSCFPDRLQQVLVHGAIPPQVHNFAFTFFWTSWCSYQPICPIPFVRSLWISALSSSTSTSALKSIWSYCPDFKKSEFWFLRGITSNQLPAGVPIANITLWSQWESQFLTHLDSAAHLLGSYLTKLAQRLLRGNMSKGLDEIKVYNIHSFLLVHRSRHLNRDGELWFFHWDRH